MSYDIDNPKSCDKCECYNCPILICNDCIKKSIEGLKKDIQNYTLIHADKNFIYGYETAIKDVLNRIEEYMEELK